MNFSYTSNNSLLVFSKTISDISFSNLHRDNGKVVTSDFTGDGTMDFIVYPIQRNKIWTFWDPEKGSPLTQGIKDSTIRNFEEILPVTWLTANNKILTGQGFVVIKNTGLSDVKFEIKSAGTTQLIYPQYEKTWVAPAKSSYSKDCTGGDYKRG